MTSKHDRNVAGFVDTGRRGFLKTAGAAALVTPFAALGFGGGNAWAQAAKPVPLNFAWNQTSFCLTPVAVAKDTGIFARNGLDVTLTNYAGSTDSLLESLATGKADAAVGMIHRWLKPLESGFDVKIVAGLHGGCVRLLGYKPAKVTKLADLKGKSIGVQGMDSPARHFFSVFLQKNGIDPERDVTWRVYQGSLLSLAASKGEVQAIADYDPLLFTIERDSKGAFVELATNISGQYHDKTCCVIGVGGKLVRERRPVVAALAKSLIEAYDWTSTHIPEAARIFLNYTTNIALDDLTALYKKLNLHHHPIGVDLRDEIAFFAQDFKDLGVLKAGTDPRKYADHVFYKIL
ncbi:MAG: ABC transporter substrate-binding protein [Zoogloeaceae bacterium]|jgi:NitT/TauT family transport system substrate-binding protein|nr:ABC transporter substrate-binding protein [Zoogloeaceae bacterium]